MHTGSSFSQENNLYLNISEPKDFFQLLKPRVMSLVIFTALVGMVVSSTNENAQSMHLFLKVISLLSIAVGAGASGALNMWYDADIDHIMKRTQNRPIPSGKIAPETARDFGIWLSFFSVMTLALASNYLAAFLLAFTIFFYAVIYSMFLKRTTPQNIVIGGLAGALPPVISGVALTGTFTIETLILCAIIFFWTPPHFWALSLVKKQDYADVNIPMMPNIKGDMRTIYEIIIYCALLFFIVLMPIYLEFANLIYASWAIGFGFYYFLSCFKIYLAYQSENYHKVAMKSFFISIIYLFGLFLSLLIENILLVNML